MAAPISTIRKLSIIIPAFNEASSIAQVIERVENCDVGSLERQIIVVDDGSKDGTGAIVRQFPAVRLVVHDKNGGKGKAVKSGFAVAEGDVLLIQDGDLEYDPDDYKQLLQPLLDGEADAVMGTRFAFSSPKFFFGERRSPFFTHYLGNKAIVALTNLLYRYDGTDYEGGTKAFLKPAVDSLVIETDGFEFDNELICKMLRKKFRIVERPIGYAPRTYVEGKKINWKDGVRMLWTIVKWRFKRC